MSLVIFDLGAADWGTETSLNKLVERFQPDTIYAYDANPVFGEGTRSVGRTTIIQRREAAWVHDGFVRFYGSGSAGWVESPLEGTSGVKVPCVDIAMMIRDICESGRRRIMAKLDIEGGEHIVIPHLVATDTDLCLELLMVERHGGTDKAWNKMMSEVRCPVEPWV